MLNDHSVFYQATNRFAEIADKPQICLLWLLLFDALANPYAGLVHDSRLYALQALAQLNPEMFADDLYFTFGSQDAFSIFSLIHAQLVTFFGVYHGTAFLFFISRVLFLVSVLSFFRNFFNDRVKAFLVACLIICGPLHYIFFDINEPFLTPRIAAMGLSLLAFSAAFRQSPFLSMLFVLAAGLMHPLIALAPAIIIFILWVINKNRNALMIMVVGGCLGIIILLLKSDALMKLNFFDVIDTEWWEIIRNRSTYLFPFEWLQDEWQWIIVNLLTAVFSFRYLNKIQKQFLSLVLFCVIGGILMTLFTAHMIPLALPFQLQPWRSFWILRIISPALALIWGLGLWQQKLVFKKIAALIVMIPAIFYGGVAGESLYFILIAGVLDVLPLKRLNDVIENESAVKLLFAVAGVLTLLPLFMVLSSLRGIQLEYGRMFILSLVAASLPILRPLCLILPAVIESSKRFLVEGALVILMGVLFFTGISPDAGYPLRIQTERNIVKPISLPDAVTAWKKKIPPGSTILTDGSIVSQHIWFVFKSCSYYSWEQGAGMVFNRNLALAYEKRKNEIKKGFGDNWQSWCQKNGIDFVISKKKLSPTPLACHKGIRLYAVN